MTLIEAKNISKIYHFEAKPFFALEDISFSIDSGECVAISGPSGSGKSTLMHIIGLLDRPSGGQYLLSGQLTSNLNSIELAHLRNSKIGFVFQSYFLLPRLNVVSNVMLPLFYRGLAPKTAGTMALDILKNMGMDQYTHQYPSQLSGGQQQRIAIARALVGSPDIILADEPTGALDSSNAKRIMQLLFTINKNERKTLIVVTHNEEICEQCQRIIYIRDGKLI